MEPTNFPELMDFTDFAKLMNFTEVAELREKDQTHGKVQSPGRSNSWKKRVPAPQPTPIHQLSKTSLVWNISIGQLGLVDWLCSLPALVHLLIS